MALVGLGVFYGGVIVGIPTVTGVAQGVQEQKRVNAEAADDTRMVKFYIDAFCEADDPKAKAVHGMAVCMHKERLWLCPKDPKTGAPISQSDGPAPHPFTGFYIMYPDEDRNPPQRGMVSTISVDPPMLNWLYVDKDTLEVKHGNRSGSIKHIVGPWDWTKDEKGVTLQGEELFVAVEEKEPVDGLKWRVFFDKDDNFLNNRKMVGGKTVLQISLDRRILPEELIKQQEQEQNQKMQIKSEGAMGSKWGAKSV